MDSAAVETENYLAPRNELESQLQKIWEETLGRKPIGVHDNFFDLGGHSLLAVKLFAQMEKQLAKKVPLSLLFQSPTIAQLAEAIRDGESPKKDSCLIEIQPNGTRPPIFWLHTLGGGGGGGVVRYQKLSQLLGPDQPSYGLVAPPEPFTKIELMAAHYINVLRAIQPVGPYHLAGYCFGGVIAFEMAQQLRARGDEVGMLALLDSTPANIPGEKSFQKISPSPGHFLKRLARFLKQSPPQMFATFKRRFRKLKRRLSGGKSHKPFTLEDVIDMSQYPKEYKRYAEVHWKALLDYWPKIYSGKIVLFQTTDSSANVSPEHIWKRLAEGGLEVKKIPGSHEKMLEEPSVQTLAAELKNFLGRSTRHEARTA